MMMGNQFKINTDFKDSKSRILTNAVLNSSC